MTFWEHLDELRTRIFHALLAVIAAAIVCFCFKEQLFAIILAPKPSFLQLINVEIAQQFLTHLKAAMLMAVLLVSPYLIYQLFAFVAPGLYKTERRMALRATLSGYLLFISGVLLNYFAIFPITINFLGTYQVDSSIPNTITLNSYTSLLFIMSLMMGLVFELPILSWLLAAIGLLHSAPMRRYRRHAIVVILIIAAVITPTGDPITLTIVSAPIYLLWELSILIVKKTEK